MAQGIRHCMSFLCPKIMGNVVLNAGTAWTAGNPIFPMLSLSWNPKQFRTWFVVTHF